ncbi:hypothetical protein SEA_SIXAMA_18 [Gordonia phage Sixama]|uniref:Uncharacterized protein n=1 Tax=Gordonia phage Sixama TaxID=2653271 RepID=A0A5Q2F3Y0_9CAUD|nr:hypothetical protein PP302_gp018 [Gordonia phage Sixama]QGF20197.1 hypothetical protein SEA_SIXAMA_18 [Gordonia phage Sixama]
MDDPALAQLRAQYPEFTELIYGPEDSELRTRDGDRLVYTEPSNDGNLEGGWCVFPEGEEYPTLCEYFEPRSEE